MVGLWREGALWLNTYRKSAKVRNIARDPRVCCLVVDGTEELVPPAAVVHGHAEILPPGARMPEVGPTAVIPAGVTDGLLDTVAERVASAKRAIVRIESSRVEWLA